MINLDNYVKSFIDNNWLAMGIFLILLRSAARQFALSWLRKVYLVLNNALEFIRPSSKGTPSDVNGNNK